MPSPEPALDLVGTQRWLQDRIVGPHEGRSFEAPADGPDYADVVKPSAALTSEERVGLYTGMYLARLVECLEADFPAVFAILGEDAFWDLARGYLARYPSRSWTLNVLGRSLARYLDEASDDEVAVDREVLRDVAALEIAMSEVFDEDEREPLPADAFLTVPEDAWPEVRLETIPALRLLPVCCDANAIVSAARQERALPPLERRPGFAAVYRGAYRVWRMTLSAPAFAFLGALASGHPLGEAIASASEVHEGPPEELEGAVFRWLRDWVQEGLFCGITV